MIVLLTKAFLIRPCFKILRATCCCLNSTNCSWNCCQNLHETRTWWSSLSNDYLIPTMSRCVLWLAIYFAWFLAYIEKFCLLCVKVRRKKIFMIISNNLFVYFWEYCFPLAFLFDYFFMRIFTALSFMFYVKWFLYQINDGCLRVEQLILINPNKICFVI